MLKSFISFLLLTIVITGESQQVQVANLDRLKYKTGVMILYYGPNRVVKYCSLWDVKFKKEDNEDQIADLLKSRVAASDPYMYFEFKEGFDCNNATGYLQKKGVSKMGISSCTYINFSENTSGAVLQPGIGASDYNSDKGNDSVIIELPTYSWKLVDNILKKRQPALEKDGWRRVYTEYNLAGGNKNLWVGKALSFSPDSMYKVITTVVNSNYYLKLLNFDKPLVDGYPYQEFFKEYAGDSLGESIAFRPTEPIKKIIAAVVSSDEVNTNNAGIVVLRKKYSLQDEFQSILDDAKNNFTGYRLNETKDPNGVPVFVAMKVLGLKKPTIFTKNEKDWTYIQTCEKNDPYAETIKTEVLKIIDGYVKTGNYLTESGPYEGDMYYRLLDKKSTTLFQLVETPKLIQSLFFGTKVYPVISNNKEDKNLNTGNTNINTTVAVAIPFIDNTKNYLFKNWEEAKLKYSWNWLETPADDKNVYRFFFNFSSGFNNPDSSQLSINQKVDDYTWALTKPDANKPGNYTLSAILGMAENKNNDCGQGLIIQYRDGKKDELARLFFIINPIKQTYWFGSYSPGKNEWATHNHYTGNTYNIFTNAINKHSNGANMLTKNIISVKKEANRFLLYINNQLVDTVELNKKNDALRNFEGIGIVTVHKQSSGVDRISLSED